MINWRTTLGGAIFALGTFLFGGPVALTMTAIEIPSKWLQATAFAGFILMGIGGFVTAIFARDRHVSDEQAGAGQQKPMPVEIVKPLTPPPSGITTPP